jgi:hypothetical protein
MRRVGAQDVDAHLALFVPVIGKSGHGVDTTEADSGFFVPKLVGGCRVPLGELLGVDSACVSLDKSLLAVAVDADEDGADDPDGDRGLDNVEQVDRSWPTVGSRT